MIALVATNLTVVRAGKTILDRAGARFEGGALVGVIGANGAGKSTFLTALAGLAKLDGGDVTLDGEDLAGIDRRLLARRRAFLPQNPRAEWPISVERLIALGLTPQLPAFGDLPAAFQPRIDQVIADCDLETQRDQPATTLSGGELARAMLARALVGEPQILIADEPMAGLDPRHALDTVQRLRGHARAGGCVVASIHDLTLAARYADRLLVLHQGRVIAEGPTAQVLTPDLLRQAFEIEACVSGAGDGAYVDFVGAAR